MEKGLLTVDGAASEGLNSRSSSRSSASSAFASSNRSSSARRRLFGVRTWHAEERRTRNRANAVAASCAIEGKNPLVFPFFVGEQLLILIPSVFPGGVSGEEKNGGGGS